MVLWKACSGKKSGFSFCFVLFFYMRGEKRGIFSPVKIELFFISGALRL